MRAEVEVHATTTVYDPTVGNGPVGIHTNIESVRLTLSDLPVVLVVPTK